MPKIFAAHALVGLVIWASENSTITIKVLKLRGPIAVAENPGACGALRVCACTPSCLTPAFTRSLAPIS